MEDDLLPLPLPRSLTTHQTIKQVAIVVSFSFFFLCCCFFSSFHSLCIKLLCKIMTWRIEAFYFTPYEKKNNSFNNYNSVPSVQVCSTSQSSMFKILQDLPRVFRISLVSRVYPCLAFRLLNVAEMSLECKHVHHSLRFLVLLETTHEWAWSVTSIFI